MTNKKIIDALALLGCYAAFVGRCLPTFRDRVPIPLSRVKLIN